MATLITTNGEIKDITPKNKKDGFTLEELYGHIGNGCDMVEVAFRFIDDNDKREHMVLVDEEGLVRQPQQPFNWKASSDFIAKYHQPIYLHGNVVICDNKEFQ